MNENYLLLVEDEAELREVLVELLQDDGYKVVQAENGKVALDYLRSNPAPYLVLLDYMMPVMDGKKFCEERAKDSKLLQIPVALLTAATLSKNTIDNLQVSIVLAKPIDMNCFFQTIRKYSSIKLTIEDHS